MKRLLFSCFLLLLFFFCLFHLPSFTDGCRSGLGLWWNQLVPTLLPFLFLAGLLSAPPYASCLSPLLAPLLRLLHLPADYGCLLLVGFTAGMPVNACLLSECGQRETSRSLLYPLLLSSHFSLGFLTGYVSRYVLGGQLPVRKLLLFLWLPPLLAGRLLLLLPSMRPPARLALASGSDPQACTASPSTVPPTRLALASGSDLQACTASPSTALTAHHALTSSSFAALLSRTARNALRSIVIIGLLLMLVSGLTACLSQYVAIFCRAIAPKETLQHALLPLLAGCLEITTGLSLLADAPLPLPIKTSVAVFCCLFGGLCVQLQLKAMCRRPYSFAAFFSIKISTALAGAIAVLILF